MRLAQLLGEDDLVAQAPAAAAPAAPASMAPSASSVKFPGNPFDDVLAKAIESLEGVNRSEVYANQMIDKYIRGEADIQDVMVAQSKMSVMMQLAVTTVNASVNTFKEITQMQI
jgi:flagellar hook-basal body complex protein FliE